MMQGGHQSDPVNSARTGFPSFLAFSSPSFRSEIQPFPPAKLSEREASKTAMVVMIGFIDFMMFIGVSSDQFIPQFIQFNDENLIISDRKLP